MPVRPTEKSTGCTVPGKLRGVLALCCWADGNPHGPILDKQRWQLPNERPAHVLSLPSIGAGTSSENAVVLQRIVVFEYVAS